VFADVDTRGGADMHLVPGLDVVGRRSSPAAVLARLGELNAVVGVIGHTDEWVATGNWTSSVARHLDVDASLAIAIAWGDGWLVAVYDKGAR
jgi:hypothetical protein